MKKTWNEGAAVEVVKTGSLQKFAVKGGLFGKNWKIRTFSYTNNGLLTYADGSTVKRGICVPLFGLGIISNPTSQHHPNVRDGPKSFVLQFRSYDGETQQLLVEAASDTEASQWVAILSKDIVGLAPSVGPPLSLEIVPSRWGTMTKQDEKNKYLIFTHYLSDTMAILKDRLARGDHFLVILPHEAVQMQCSSAFSTLFGSFECSASATYGLVFLKDVPPEAPKELIVQVVTASETISEVIASSATFETTRTTYKMKITNSEEAVKREYASDGLWLLQSEPLWSVMETELSGCLYSNAILKTATARQMLFAPSHIPPGGEQRTLSFDFVIRQGEEVSTVEPPAMIPTLDALGAAGFSILNVDIPNPEEVMLMMLSSQGPLRLSFHVNLAKVGQRRRYCVSYSLKKSTLSFPVQCQEVLMSSHQPKELVMAQAAQGWKPCAAVLVPASPWMIWMLLSEAPL